MQYIITASLIIYAVWLVRTPGISMDAILGSTGAVLGFDILLVIVGVSILSIGFLVAAIVFVWLIEALRRPRVAMFRLPGGLVLGFGVMHQPVGVAS